MINKIILFSCLWLILRTPVLHAQYSTTDFQTNNGLSGDEIAKKIITFENEEVLQFRTTYSYVNNTFYLFEPRSRYFISIDANEKVDTLLYLDENYIDLKIEVNKAGTAVYFWDRGLGRVLNYNIEEGKLTRIDHSFPFKAYYGHSAIITEEDEIYIMGGYGLFDYKNRLLNYNQTYNEWLLKTVSGNIPPRGNGNILYYLENEHTLLYIYIEKTKNNYVSVYSINLNDLVWVKEGFFKNSIMQVQSKFVNQNYSYGYDPMKGIAVIDEFHYYDYFNNEMIVLENPPKINSINGHVSFYNPEKMEWIILGNTVSEDKSFGISSFKTTDIFNSNTKTIIYPHRWYHEMWIQYLFYGSFGLVGLLLFIRRRFIGNESERDGTLEILSPLSLMKKDDCLEVQIKGRVLTVIEPQMTLFWSWLFEQKMNNRNQVIQQDFDELMFGTNYSNAHLTRSRKKLIQSVNKETGLELITIKQSEMDKRYKVVCIDLEMISAE